jgi:hypothetical protein
MKRTRRATAGFFFAGCKIVLDGGKGPVSGSPDGKFAVARFVKPDCRHRFHMLVVAGMANRHI